MRITVKPTQEITLSLDEAQRIYNLINTACIDMVDSCYRCPLNHDDKAHCLRYDLQQMIREVTT